MFGRRASMLALLIVANGCAQGSVPGQGDDTDGTTDGLDIDGGGGTDDGVDIDAGATFARLTLTATGAGTVILVPAGVPCGADCTAYAPGTAVTISTDPVDGTTVSGWTGACTSTAPTCALTLTADATTNVTFGASAAGSFAFAGITQTFVVPAGTAQLHVVADGASGGNVIGSDANTYLGGFGAHVDTVVAVTPGATLTVLVGQQPSTIPYAGDGCGGNGGGGTFVGDGATAVVVAGAGGGANGYSSALNGGGNASLLADGGSSGALVGGTGGNGGAGQAGFDGGGGGGFAGMGITGAGGGGSAFIGGGGGGAHTDLESCPTTTAGYGGGGGGGRDRGGGGGGYSGGAACDFGAGIFSGGGGSYGLGAPSITLRVVHGNGALTLTPT